MEGRKPTRSDRFSVPVTLLNCFMVSKATQNLAINLPPSARNINKQPFQGSVKKRSVDIGADVIHTTEHKQLRANLVGAH